MLHVYVAARHALASHQMRGCASTSTANFCWGQSSLNLRGSVGLSMRWRITRISLAIAPTAGLHVPDITMAILNRIVGSTKLCSSILPANLFKFSDSTSEKLSSVSARCLSRWTWRAPCHRPDLAPRCIPVRACGLTSTSRHHGRTPLSFGGTSHSSGNSSVQFFPAISCGSCLPRCGSVSPSLAENLLQCSRRRVFVAT